jgi:hypothetical protein
LERSPSLRFIGKLPLTNWEQYTYESQQPLHGEDDKVTPPFYYTITCRPSGSRVLILGAARQIVEHLIRRDLEKVLSPSIRRVSIAVDDLELILK